MRLRSFTQLLSLALGLQWTLMASAQSPPASPEARIQPQVITNSIGMKLVQIPAGSFRMGSPSSEEEREPEETLHEVTFSKPFWIGMHEVTQGEWGQLDQKYKAFYSEKNGGSADHPMENIEWNHAMEFCHRLTALPQEQRAGRKYRLPYEAEWEYACRAGSKSPFYFGDSLSSKQANFNGRFPYGDAEAGPYLRMSAKVGSYPPNAFGLYDMHGNVAEWCADWYDPDYYTASPEESPRGPPVGVQSDDYGNHFLVVRGGSWLDDARACRSAYRHRAMHRNSYRTIGFRVVCEM